MTEKFVGIALSHTISEINALLHFMQKFKMPKITGKSNFDKKCHMIVYLEDQKFH